MSKKEGWFYGVMIVLMACVFTYHTYAQEYEALERSHEHLVEKYGKDGAQRWLDITARKGRAVADATVQPVNQQRTNDLSKRLDEIEDRIAKLEAQWNTCTDPNELRIGNIIKRIETLEAHAELKPVVIPAPKVLRLPSSGTLRLITPPGWMDPTYTMPRIGTDKPMSQLRGYVPD